MEKTNILAILYNYLTKKDISSYTVFKIKVYELIDRLEIKEETQREVLITNIKLEGLEKDNKKISMFISSNNEYIKHIYKNKKDYTLQKNYEGSIGLAKNKIKILIMDKDVINQDYFILLKDIPTNFFLRKLKLIFLLVDEHKKIIISVVILLVLYLKYGSSFLDFMKKVLRLAL